MSDATVTTVDQNGIEVACVKLSDCEEALFKVAERAIDREIDRRGSAQVTARWDTLRERDGI